MRLIQHLATLVDGDHLSLRTDRLLQQVQAHAGTAADIQHGLPRLQRQMLDGATAQCPVGASCRS